MFHMLWNKQNHHLSPFFFSWGNWGFPEILIVPPHLSSPITKQWTTILSVNIQFSRQSKITDWVGFSSHIKATALQFKAFRHFSSRSMGKTRSQNSYTNTLLVSQCHENPCLIWLPWEVKLILVFIRHYACLLDMFIRHDWFMPGYALFLIQAWSKEIHSSSQAQSKLEIRSCRNSISCWT